MAADLHELLAAIDPAQLDYTGWVSVGMAIKHEGGFASDWEAWSARDSKRYHQGECEKKWPGFQGSGTPVTGGTLVELARQHGWSPSHHGGHNEAMGWDDVIERPNDSLRFIDPGWVEAVEMVTPTDSDWDPVKDLRTYLSTLFESHEHVGYVVNCWVNDEGRSLPKKGSYSRTAGELLSELARYNDLAMVVGDCDPDVGAWIRFNPLDGQGVRDDNVTSFRYALVESDTLAIEKQAAIYSELELPIAALVHSGGKSLHAIVRINATSKEEYRERVAYLHKVCKQNGLEIDTQNKNPSRLSRMPGVMRKGQKQYLVGINQGKESFEVWREFVEEANDQLPDFEPLSDIYDNMPALSKPLIEGVLREGHKGLLTGPSKAGKSYMLLQLTLAIAEGREWLGWPCAQGRVLYVNLELDRASCLHRIRDLYDKLGWAPDNLQNIDLWNLRGKAVPMDLLAPKLIRRSLKRGYKAIIIDPIYKVITGDENAADKMAFFCNQFDRVCSELGAAVIYCHHHSKGAQGQKSARDRSSGSGVFARDPDAILDIIELNVSDAAREAMVDRHVADRVCEVLDAARPGWRDDFPQDDAVVGDKVLGHAKELFGNDDIDRDIGPIKQSLAQATGWRMEGTLREFAPMSPRHFWFRHPFHTVSGAHFLADAKAEGEEPPWMAQQEAAKAAREKARKARLDKLAFAFSDLSFEDGFAGWQKMAKDSGVDGLIADDGKPTKLFTGLLQALKLKCCRDGNVRTLIDADQWQSENPEPEKLPKAQADWAEKERRTRVAIRQAQAEASDGIAMTGAVAALLGLPGKNPVVTARNWIDRLPEFSRNSDGQILPARTP